MKRSLFVFCVFCLGLIARAAGAQTATHVTDEKIPYLRRQGTETQLILDGQPFLIRGGELGNSTAASLEYLAPYWAKFSAMHLNTIVAPVYWDLLEPTEGHFDFSLVDGLISQAREHHMRLVLLWFGSWKNSMSCYAPAWVKTDLKRFPRARDHDGRALEILSPFNATNCETDAHSFAALMRHLRSFDGSAHTVLMVQVENEIGMIPDARDHSPAADESWRGAVPAELMTELVRRRDRQELAPELTSLWAAAGNKTAGTWPEVFGPQAGSEEVFMAWTFARYVERVAAAGKAEYPLPMYVNAALMRTAYQPGQYPSAGPLPQVFDVWALGAPTIDLVSPDIYFPDFTAWCDRYTRGGRSLFIPEALRGPDVAVNALYAYGQYGAIGFCPFGIESIGEPAQGSLTASFDLVEQLTPRLLAASGRGEKIGLLPPDITEQRQPQQIRLGGYLLNVTYERTRPSALADGVIVPVGATAPGGPVLAAGGLAIVAGPNEYFFAGTGLTVTFASAVPGELVGIVSAEEGHFEEGRWISDRRLGGDQTHQGRHLRLEPGHFSMQRIELYRYR